MKQLRTIAILFISIACLSACKDNEHKKEIAVQYQCPMKCEGEKTYDNKGSCPICKMDIRPLNKVKNKKALTTEISENSIFNLKSTWKTEEAKTIQLKSLRGKTLVVVMIYTTCKAACPRLVADMRSIESKVSKETKEAVSYVLVSIDPETDTPKKLKSFAIENFMNGEQWTFLQGNTSSVREFANVLAVKYKEISPLDFSHSNIISVFNPEGELVHQQEGLGVDNKETIQKIIATTNSTLKAQ